MVKILFSFVLSSLVASPAYAQGGRTLTVNLGSKISFWTLVGNVLSFMANAATFIAPIVFLVGVLQYTLGGVNGGRADAGKKLMLAAVVGYAVIIGSYSMLRVVYYFLQG